jgi:hypothetical protein
MICTADRVPLRLRAAALVVPAVLAITAAAMPPVAARTGATSGDSLGPASTARAEAPAHYAHGRRSVVELRTYTGQRPPARPGRAAFRRMLDRSDAWLREGSGGRYGFARTRVVTRWLKISYPRNGCGRLLTGALKWRALKAARKQGYRPARFGFTIYYHNSRCPQGKGAVPTPVDLNDPQVWLYGAPLSPRAFTYHVGEALGLGQAGTYECFRNGLESSLFGRCEQRNGTDWYSLMSYWHGWGHLSAEAKHRLRWLDDLRVVRRSGTVRLAPLEGARSGRGRVHAARVHAGKVRYWLEYRSARGFDRGHDREDYGVIIRRGGWPGGLVDPTPYTLFNDVVLPVGSTFTTPQGVRLAVTAVGPKAATVQVDYDAPRPRAPRAPGDVAATVDGASVEVSWDRPEDRGGVIDRYVVTESPEGWQYEIDGPGGSRPSTRFTGLGGGQHTFTVVAHNEHGASAPVTTAPVAVPSSS